MAEMTATMIERDAIDAPSGVANGDDRRTIMRLAEEVLPKLIERLAASELGELEVREDGWRVRLRRPKETSEAGSGTETKATARPRQRGGSDGASSSHKSAGGRSAQRPHTQKGPIDRGHVKAVGVGYFVAHDGVAVGSPVRNGDVLGYVDVLGVRQEIVSPIDGTLRALEVESGQAVEYGETIARIESRSEAHVQ